MLDHDQIKDWSVTPRVQCFEFATEEGAKKFAFGLSVGGATLVRVEGCFVFWVEDSTD